MWSLFGYEDAKLSNHSKSKHHAMSDNDPEEQKPVEEALECDYERDCTNLYKQVEEENWAAISKFLETGYWPGSFFADSIPPADQVRTWVTRFDSSAKNRVRWSQLPLHLAIVVDAPYEIIGSLIELYPQAVRCTDDQHMLPLHLAMRHGASDNVVDLLLAAFPEAVNAKGKNDRTPIDCAIRGPNKIRGRILGTFVERAKAKATKSITSSYSKEVAALRAKLEDKESELSDVKSRLAALDTAKAALELDLTSKISSIGFANTREADEASITIKHKITELEQEKADLQAAQMRAWDEETKLIEELEKVHEEVARTASPEDLTALMEEIEALKVARKESNENSLVEVEEMKKHIEEELSKTDGATQEELEAMKRNIEELHRVASADAGSATDEDITTLKDEVDELRKELKRKEEAAKMRVDLSLLKEELVAELRDKDTKTDEQIASIEEALNSLKATDLESKTNDELKALKTELETLKEDVKERRLADKLTEDVTKLRRRVHDLKVPVNGKTKQDVLMMKSTLRAIKVVELQTKSNDELLALSKNLKVLSDQLAEMEEAAEMRSELANLKSRLETELKEAKGGRKEGAPQIKAAIQKISKLDTKTVFELVALKFELESIQDQIKLKQESREIKEGVLKLKTETATHLRTATGKNKEELSAVKMALDAMDIKKLENKSREEVNVAKAELSSAKKRLADAELAKKIKMELRSIRTAFSVDLKKCKEESDEKGTKELEGAIAKLSEEDLDKKSTQELIAAKDEASVIRHDLKEKAEVSRNLKTIKLTLDDLLQRKEGKAREDLLAMKKTVEAIDPHDLDTKDEEEWNDLKAQIAILKKELADADIATTTTQDLVSLKEALNKAIEESEGSAKNELTTMKTAVDAIDVSKLDSCKNEEWEALRSEVEALKKDLKTRECEGLLASIKERMVAKSGMSKIEIARTSRRIAGLDQGFESKTYSELVEAKKELQSIFAELPKTTPTQSVRASPSPRKSEISKPARTPSSKKPAAENSARQSTKEPTAKGVSTKEPTAKGVDKSPRKSLFGRFRASSKKGLASAEKKKQEETKLEEDKAMVPEGKSTPEGKTMSDPSKKIESGKDGDDTGSLTGLIKITAEEITAPAPEDRDATVSEEKKEDPEEPRSPDEPRYLPPLAPGRVPVATPKSTSESSETDCKDDDPTDIKLTRSKTLVNSGGEVETVVVE